MRYFKPPQHLYALSGEFYNTAGPYKCLSLDRKYNRRGRREYALFHPPNTSASSAVSFLILSPYLFYSANSCKRNC